jgi:hypothetical protein
MFIKSFIVSALLSATSASITDCSKGLSLFSIQSLQFYPDPAIKNENSTIAFTYTVPPPGVTGGTATYSATYNFLPLSPTVEDLCTSVACPIAPGPYYTSTTTIFPDLTGTLVAKIQWKDTSGVQLLCAEVRTKIA